MLIITVFLFAMEFTQSLKIDITQFEVYQQEGFAVSDDGIIVICDSEACNLIYLDPEGKLIRRVAGKGQGPGEFQRPGWIEWLEGEQIFRVGDYANRRFSSWTDKGKLVKENPFPKGGAFFYIGMPKHQILFSRDPAGHFEGRPRLVVYNFEGEEIKEIWDHPLDKPKEVTAAELPNNGGSVARLLRWDPRLSFGVGDGFIAVTWGESSTIQVIDFQGKQLEKSFQVELPQFPLTKEQIQDQVLEFDESYRTLLAQNIVLREFWPATSFLSVDQSNRIWAFSFQKKDGDPYTFRVFDRQGKHLGGGKIHEIPTVIHNDKLYFIHENKDEEINLEVWNYKL